MMGHTEDPKDGGAVAGAVFGAVAVYGVCHPNTARTTYKKLEMKKANNQTGFPNILRKSSMATHA
jgi:hypothetical protein